MSLEAAFRAARESMISAGAAWALVGGLAVGTRTEPRFTRDIDLAVVVPDDRAAETLLRRLMGQGYTVLALVEQTAVGRLATARLQVPGSDYLVDLLFASSGIEGETVQDADIVEVFPGLTAPVARVPHLAAMKLLARDDRTRDQDRGDLRRLLQRATPVDLEATRELLRTIHRRGYHRGRELQQALTLAEQEFTQRNDTLPT